MIHLRHIALHIALARRVASDHIRDLQGPRRNRFHTLHRQAEDIQHALRGARTSYENYLYQALGRKVDFEMIEVARGKGVSHIVTAKYIVQKGSTEPMAPRFYIEVTVTPKDDEFEEGVNICATAGFISAIGMRHEKFTQDSLSAESVKEPTSIFGWIEYLEGDFLKAKRLVRPFGDGESDMGILE